MSYLVATNAKVLETKDKDKCLISRNNCVKAKAGVKPSSGGKQLWPQTPQKPPPQQASTPPLLAIMEHKLDVLEGAQAVEPTAICGGRIRARLQSAISEITNANAEGNREQFPPHNH